LFVNKTIAMKNLLKLPVLILALMLVVSCGDSKKEEEEKKLSPVEQAAADAKKLAELECDFEIALLEDGSDKVEKLEEQLKKMNEEMEQKWGDEEDDKIRDAAMKAYDNVVENCAEKIAEAEEKIAEAEEKARQDRISEVTDDAKKAAEFECELYALQQAGDMDKFEVLQDEMNSFLMEMEQKWGQFDDDAEMMQAVQAAYEKIVENCIG